MSFAGDIEAFVRVVEAGGFTAAARTLGMTPSAISKLVGRLEDRLGARLFRRTTRRLSLTQEGEAFYRHGARIAADIAEAERAVSELGRVARGTLRVNAAMNFGHHQIEPILAEFLDRYPEMRIDLTLSDSFVNLVEEEVDVAIRAGHLADSSLVARKLGEFGRVIVATPAYLERHGTPATPADLARHNCIMFGNHQPHLNQWPFLPAADDKQDGRSSEPRHIAVSGNVVANNGETVVQLALHGVGIARLSEFAVGDAIRKGQLISLLQDSHAPERMPISAVYLPPKGTQPKVRAFVDFLLEKFQPTPPWEA
ncbi:MAG: LysR family transcriptional regulator [Alphaproteobacteria bacterium]|nr:LysR family transcriptional regulator [Alphaproteobacteria bacterium]